MHGLAKRSADTALRDNGVLLAQGILIQEEAGGRAHYELSFGRTRSSSSRTIMSRQQVCTGIPALEMQATD